MRSCYWGEPERAHAGEVLYVGHLYDKVQQKLEHLQITRRITIVVYWDHLYGWYVHSEHEE